MHHPCRIVLLRPGKYRRISPGTVGDQGIHPLFLKVSACHAHCRDHLRHPRHPRHHLASSTGNESLRCSLRKGVRSRAPDFRPSMPPSGTSLPLPPPPPLFPLLWNRLVMYSSHGPWHDSRRWGLARRRFFVAPWTWSGSNVKVFAPCVWRCEAPVLYPRKQRLPRVSRHVARLSYRGECIS